MKHLEVASNVDVLSARYAIEPKLSVLEANRGSLRMAQRDRYFEFIPGTKTHHQTILNKKSVEQNRSIVD